MSYKAMALAIEVVGLSPTQKLTLVVLASHDGAGGCWPGTRSLAGKVGVTDRQIRRHLRELAELGLITIEVNGGGTDETRRDRRPNRYTLHLNGVTPASTRSTVERGDTSVHPFPDGGTSTTERVDTDDRNGVTPASTELVLEAALEEKPPPDDRSTRAGDPFGRGFEEDPRIDRAALQRLIKENVEKGREQRRGRTK